jgi:hypothetical protein
MATGDVADMVVRIKAVLPPRWFPEPNSDGSSNTPVLDGVLTGLAYAWAQVWALLQFTKLQGRIATATGSFLDIIAQDYLGSRIVRKPGQGDPSFRIRIMREIVRARATRPALIQVLLDLTGHAPIVFEPRWPPDTGGWGSLGMAVGTGLEYGSANGTIPGAGGWGSLTLPFQLFVTAFRGSGGGIPNVGGYYRIGTGPATGGYGIGAIEWASLSMSGGQVTDDDINAAIASVLPVATTAWTRISNGSLISSAPLFVLGSSVLGGPNVLG